MQQHWSHFYRHCRICSEVYQRKKSEMMMTITLSMGKRQIVIVSQRTIVVHTTTLEKSASKSAYLPCHQYRNMIFHHYSNLFLPWCVPKRKEDLPWSLYARSAIQYVAL